ncbi:hypothetical protein E9549_00745 [Blastococcus sp. MG754426]|uniref:hypothetical protein n=1 Tax=unclassified Blastococcus TaxID=2619396 RepID=UPI001EF005E0|nr:MULTISPECIES: hypothetical protein [unclassified Blastococcus]MCF6505944.1 hypothetical protein [Blastococcus sp. MG754426]MCF6510669.1 hypothetical protein [Blastococcus sp. MG754427]
MSTRPLRIAGLLALALLLTACADTGGGAGGSPAEPSSPAGDDATVVLQVSEVGGFTTPAMLAARVPSATLYADGRLITDGPVIAIWPAPALPNLQVHRLGDGGVRDLVDRAIAAGVTETGDLGTPPVADVTSTRFTVRTGGETVTREVYALGMGAGPRGELDPGITEEQAAARARLSELAEALRDPVAALGADRVSGPEPYQPEAVAAVVSPYVEVDPPQAELPWPGPALPGEPIAPGTTCVTATGEQAQAVLRAAAEGNAATPWVGEDGSRWSVVLRPLLPHESGCADLTDR